MAEFKESEHPRNPDGTFKNVLSSPSDRAIIKTNAERKDTAALIKNVTIEPKDISNTLNDFDLPDSLLDNLIEDLKDYSVENKSSNEIFNDLLKLDTLNHQVNKGYGSDRTIAEEVYPIKNKMIIELIKNKNPDIKIKTDIDSNDEYAIPSIIYFEKGNNQISFHITKLPFQRRMAIKEVQDGVGVWNNKPGNNLISNYSKLEEYAKYKRYYNEHNSTNLNIPYIQEIASKYWDNPKEKERLTKEFDEKNKIPKVNDTLQKLQKEIILDMSNNAKKLIK